MSGVAIEGRLLSATPDELEIRVYTRDEFVDAQSAMLVEGERIRVLTDNGFAYKGEVKDAIELDDDYTGGFVYIKNAVRVGEDQHLIDDERRGRIFACEAVNWAVHDIDHAGKSSIDRRAELGGFKCWLYEVERGNSIGYRVAITPVPAGRVLFTSTSWLSIVEALAAAEAQLLLLVDQAEQAKVAEQERQAALRRSKHRGEAAF